MELLDSCTKQASVYIVKSLQEKSIQSVSLIIPEHKGKSLLETRIAGISANSRIKIFSQSDTIANLTLIIKQFGIKYQSIENDDKIIREAGLDLMFNIRQKSGELINIPDFSVFIRDTLLREEAEDLNQNEIGATKGEIPPEKKSIFSEIIEPVAIITSAAICLVLLFTVRSK